MKRVKLGLVDLDTSHPTAWIPIIREMGHEVIGVYDGGTVYPKGYADRFAAEQGISRVYDSLEAMAEEVDIAVIHSCNWDLHVPRAQPFVEAEKALLIDKPIAGNLQDLLTMREWADKGIRMSGGSSLRFSSEVREWLDTHNPPDIIWAHSGCSVDEFNYGIHAYSMLHGIMGSGIKSIRHLGKHVQHQIEMIWNDGRRATLGVGATQGYLPFYATIVTEKDVSHLQVDSNRIYSSMLSAVIPYLAGEAPAPMPFLDWIEPELAAIAAKQSFEIGGAPVCLSALAGSSEKAETSGGPPSPMILPNTGLLSSYHGESFAEEYRRKKLEFAK